MPFVAPNPTAADPNKVQISLAPTFLAGLAGRRPHQVGDFATFLQQCEQLVRAECLANGHTAPATSAFGRARGAWYEWLFSVGGLDYVNQTQQAQFFLIPLPNKDKFDYLQLYTQDVYRYFTELRQMLDDQDVTLVSSNPDFAILRRVAGRALPNAANIDAVLLASLDTMYTDYVNQFNFDDFIGFASVKTSVRGDRRLQLPAEAAAVKAYYEHLKARLWKVNSSGLVYNAVTMEYSNEDLATFKTAAIHSILSVNTKPERAVDNVVKVASSAEMLDFFNNVLR